MQKVLIIGGTNKTATSVARELENNGYSIEGMTYRDTKKVTEYFKNCIWSHLNLSDNYIVNDFIRSQKDKEYDKIIFFISNSTQINGTKLNDQRDALNQFYGVFCVNYILLINSLLSCLSDNGSIIFISSSAADNGSKDPIYSSGKALIQSYILSLNNLLKKEQSAFSISPGTIAGSLFYESLPEDHPDKLNKKAITYPKEIANLIIKSKDYSGKNVRLSWGEDWNK